MDQEREHDEFRRIEIAAKRERAEELIAGYRTAIDKNRRRINWYNEVLGRIAQRLGAWRIIVVLVLVKAASSSRLRRGEASPTKRADDRSPPQGPLNFSEVGGLLLGRQANLREVEWIWQAGAVTDMPAGYACRRAVGCDQPPLARLARRVVHLPGVACVVQAPDRGLSIRFAGPPGLRPIPDGIGAAIYASPSRREAGLKPSYPSRGRT